MTLRELSSLEVQICNELGAAFWLEAGLPGEFNKFTFMNFFQEHIDAGKGVIFGLYDGEEFIGGIGAVLTLHPLCAELWATELFMYVREDRRGGGAFGLLRKRFESWGTENGVDRFCLTALDVAKMDPVVRRAMYDNAGYSPQETIFVKPAKES